MMFGSEMFGGTGFGAGVVGYLLFAVLIVWSLIWKGLGLWFSAQRKSKPWFIVILLVNTLGILEIIYIIVVLKKKFSDILPKR